MRHAPDNLVKEEPSTGGVGEGLVVESAVEASSSIGGNRAEEAFFDGDADRATDRYLAAVKEGRLLFWDLMKASLGSRRPPPS